MSEQKTPQPPQHQDKQPGIQSEMKPRPEGDAARYKAAGKLEGKIALISGGDSGIGRAVAATFAKEGADVAIVYLEEQGDAEQAKKDVEDAGRRCILIAGDVGEAGFCRQAVSKTVETLGGLDVLVNNAAEQHPAHRPEAISHEVMPRPVQTNTLYNFK